MVGIDLGAAIVHFVAFRNRFQELHHLLRLLLLVEPSFVFYQELFDNRLNVIIFLLGRIVDLLFLTMLLHWRPENTVSIVIVFLKAILDLPTPILNSHEWLILVGLFLAVRGSSSLGALC